MLEERGARQQLVFVSNIPLVVDRLHGNLDVNSKVVFDQLFVSVETHARKVSKFNGMISV